MQSACAPEDDLAMHRRLWLCEHHQPDLHLLRYHKLIADASIKVRPRAEDYGDASMYFDRPCSYGIDQWQVKHWTTARSVLHA